MRLDYDDELAIEEIIERKIVEMFKSNDLKLDLSLKKDDKGDAELVLSLVYNEKDIWENNFVEIATSEIKISDLKLKLKWNWRRISKRIKNNFYKQIFLVMVKWIEIVNDIMED